MQTRSAHTAPPYLADGLVPQAVCRGRVLHVEGADVYIGRGQQLLRSQDAGQTFQLIGMAPASPLIRAASTFEWSARLVRTGFHGLLVLPDGALLATVRGALLHKPKQGTEFNLAHSVARGRRPLNVCLHPSGRLYFGEYFNNPQRSAVHIYGSDNGTHFDVVCTLPAGSVRHIHAIHWDPHRRGMWVLTGDNGQEAALWWTGDEFATLEPVLRGTQTARAVALFCEPSGLIVPMDTPFERNFIQHFDPSTGVLQRLAELPGSAFGSAQTGNLRLLATAVESSSVNTDQRPALYASRDGLDWRVVARLRRDFRQLKNCRPYFQHPTLVLPTGLGSTDRIFATGQALKGGHDRLFYWSEREVLQQLDACQGRVAC